MAANNNRIGITLACTECKQRNYQTTKNKKNDTDRIEIKKYCKFCKSTLCIKKRNKVEQLWHRLNSLPM